MQEWHEHLGGKAEHPHPWSIPSSHEPPSCPEEMPAAPLQGWWVIYAAAAAAAAKSLQSCPTLCDHIDGSPPGSPIPGILQARTLEWVAISFSKVIYIPAKLPGDSE